MSFGYISSCFFFFVFFFCKKKYGYFKMNRYTRPRSYKTFFMLNLAEHEICPANKYQITNNCKFLLAKHS